jgi:hypothetical protein
LASQATASVSWQAKRLRRFLGKPSDCVGFLASQATLSITWQAKRLRRLGTFHTHRHIQNKPALLRETGLFILSRDNPSRFSMFWHNIAPLWRRASCFF